MPRPRAEQISVSDTPYYHVISRCGQHTIRPRFSLADAIQNQVEQQALNDFRMPLKPLLGFEGMICNGCQWGILYRLDD